MTADNVAYIYDIRHPGVSLTPDGVRSEEALDVAKTLAARRGRSVIVDDRPQAYKVTPAGRVCDAPALWDVDWSSYG